MEIQSNQKRKWINHDQIKEGQSIDIDGLYGVDGKKIGPIPFTGQIPVRQTPHNSHKNMNKKLTAFEKMQKGLEREANLNLRSIKDILELEEPENTFLIEKLVPNQRITAISGFPGCAKSWAALYVASCVATGSALFDRFNSLQGSVLYIDGESGIFEIRRRIKLLNFSTNLPIYFLSQEGIKVDNNNDLNILIKIIKEKEIKLVIFDPFVAMHSQIENSAEDMQKVFEGIEKLTLQGVTVIIIHHHRKDFYIRKSSPGQSLRGSSAIFGRLDSAILIKKNKEDENSINLTLCQFKSRSGRKSAPFQVKLVENNNKDLLSFEYVGEEEVKKQKKEEAKELIIDLLKQKDERPRREIIEILKENEYGTRNSSEGLRELEKEAIIKSVLVGREKVYSLEEFGPEELPF